MEDDILGHSTLPARRVIQSGPWSKLSFSTKTASVLVLFLVGYVVAIRTWEVVLKWREKSYRLSMRRKHGIPDNDHRPFNVAYAAVLRARQDNEAASKVKPRPEPPIPDRRHALPEQSVRHRPNGQRNVEAAWTSGPVNGFPGGFNPSSVDSMFPSTSPMPKEQTHGSSASINHLNFADRYNPNPPPARIAEHEIDSSSSRAGPSRPSRRSSRKNLSITSIVDSKKRGINDDEFDDHEHSKKTRVEDDELIDGDEDAGWQNQHQYPPKRGSKRMLGDEEDIGDVLDQKKMREKRARKFSLEKVPQANMIEDMDVDDYEDEDELTDLKSISRGKKRDRAEAGSTFGGDEDSEAEIEIEDDKGRRSRRKRRSVGKRKSDTGTSTRGKKRDRDLDDGDSDVESGDEANSRVSRKKRGKKAAQSNSFHDGSDVSMDDSQASTKGGRRRIGDEWENNGIKYRIGPNGQRLRQALVKKARQKFTMPKDSQHPDRDANLEICVETWLTEEEFKDAKDQHLLAWQDSPKPSAEPETPSADIPESPSPQIPAGKNLLWGSTTNTPPSTSPSPASYLAILDGPDGTSKSSQVARRDPHRQSIATNLGLRINPFQQPQAPMGKRIASAARVASAFNGSSPVSPGLTDSTNGSPRGQRFSKWEKQDLEAKAMMKMREANRKKEAEKEAKEKELKERLQKEKREKEEKDKLAAVAAAPSSISFGKLPDVKPVQNENKPLALSFGPPPVPADASKSDKTPTSLFGLPAAVPSIVVTPPKAAEDKPAPKLTFPTTFPQPTQPSSTAPSFSFAKPAADTSAKPAQSMFDKTAGSEAGQKPDQKATSAFGGFSAPSTAGAATSGTSRPSFSFGAPSQAPQAFGAEQKKDNQTQGSGGGSLLSRMGGGSKEGSVPQSQAQQSNPTFSFAKPTVNEAPKTTSAFGAATTPQPAPSASASTSATAAPAPIKFNFGFGGKPPASGTTSTSGAASSSLSGALAPDASKPTSNPLFGMKSPALPAQTSGVSGTNANPTNPPAFGFSTSTPEKPSNLNAPSFSFGASSAFGATSATGGNKESTSTATQSAVAPVKSAFGGFGGGESSTNSAFSSTKPASSLFGSNTTSNAFGASSNAFGSINSSAKATETPKTIFAFGAATPSTTPTSATAEAPKSTFSFGNQAPTAGNSKFGETSTPAAPQGSLFGAQPSGQSVFGSKPAGAASGPSAFGFGAPASSSTNTTGAFAGFGAPANSANQK